MHKHYCPLGRHIWTPDDEDATTWGDRCQRCDQIGYRNEVLACPACDRRSVQVSWFIVPIICERCGEQKRNATGQGLFVSNAWLKGKRMVCPACHETEQTMAAMEQVVTWDEVDDDEVPF